MRRTIVQEIFGPLKFLGFWLVLTLMNLMMDVRFALRLLFKNPALTGVIVLVLGLGIGANTTVFTLVNAVLFRGLPYPNAEEIMALGTSNLKAGQDRMGVSYPDYLDWRKQTKSFRDLAALDWASINISDNTTLPERLNGVRISANMFPMLGQNVLIGRNLIPADEKNGAPPVCLIGYGVWKSRYGGAASVIGRTVRLNELPAVIIGVMPEGMRFPVGQDIWLPLVPTARYEKRDMRSLLIVGRLADGTTLSSARADLDTIASRLEKQYPQTNRGVRATMHPYSDQFNGGPIRIIFLALLGAVAFVLLIACANVANLLLSRSLARSREISVRAALGASRWRLIRQLLIESILLGVFGGVVGLAISFWGVRMFDLAVANVGKPYWIRFTMDYTVFGYLGLICVATGVLFGLAPALQISRVDIYDSLKEGGRGSSGGSRIKFLSSALVVGELALALVLLSGAGLMIRSFLNMYTMDLGVRKDNVLLMRYTLAEAKYPTPESQIRFHDRLLEDLRATPGVESVSLASNLPFQGSYGWKFEIEGDAPQEFEKRKSVSGVIVSPDYFQTFGVQVLRGRAFLATDGVSGSESVIVNQPFVRQHWPHGDALGRRLRTFKEDGTPKPWMQIVGVVPTIRQNDPTRVETGELIYVPLRQEPQRGMSVLAHTRVPASSLAAPFKKAIQEIDDNQPVFDLRTFDEMLVEQRWAFRVFGSLFAIFALIAVVLASVGIYAVMAYSVSQRTQEIGVRMALGASGPSVLRLIFAAGLRQLAIGVTLGLIAALAVSRVLKSLLVQITPTDPLTFVVITALLCIIAGLACWIPTSRAMRIDPVQALRHE